MEEMSWTLLYSGDNGRLDSGAGSLVEMKRYASRDGLRMRLIRSRGAWSVDATWKESVAGWDEATDS